MSWIKPPAPQSEPTLTQDHREHYVWQEQPQDPTFPGRVFVAEHPTIFEYAIMRCPKATRHAFVELIGLGEAPDWEHAEHHEFTSPTEARDAIEARWLTLPGYGHNPKGL